MGREAGQGVVKGASGLGNSTNRALRPKGLGFYAEGGDGLEGLCHGQRQEPETTLDSRWAKESVVSTQGFKCRMVASGCPLRTHSGGHAWSGQRIRPGGKGSRKEAGRSDMSDLGTTPRKNQSCKGLSASKTDSPEEVAGSLPAPDSSPGGTLR